MSARPLLRIIPLFFRSKGLLALGVLGLLAASGLNLAGPWLIARAIDVDLANQDNQGLIRTASLYLVVLLLNILVTYGAKLGLELAAQRAMVVLKERLFGHLVEHDLALHDQHPSGKLITRVQGDTASLRVLFSEVILSLPADVALLVGMFVLTHIVAPEVVPLLFCVLPPYFFLFVVFRRLAPKRFLDLRKVTAKLTGFLTESVRAMPTLRLFHRQAWANDRSEELNREVYEKALWAHLIPVGYFDTVLLVRSLGIVVLLLFGAHGVAEETITVGALVMSLGYLRQMFNPLMRLSFHMTTVERSRAAALRIVELLDTPRTIVDPERPVPWPGLREAIRLEGVEFHYEEGTPVLRGVDIEIPAGTNVGIVGATGAGKSTVLNLLLRFRDPIAGQVLVDGVPLPALAVADVRQRIGLVLQDVHLFGGTVLENLGSDRAKAERALATLDLQVDLDKALDEDGANLSRGERQLLTFARALVGDPEILVLDEATSAIDPATEARVQEALERIQQDRTTITVAHRLSTVQRCDRIYVLGHGEVREVGDHRTLLEQGGLYAALAQLQGLTT